jgi:hypothetical protein
MPSSNNVETIFVQHWQEEDHTLNVWVDWLKQMWRYTMN